MESSTASRTLEVRGLVKEFPGVKALKGVDFGGYVDTLYEGGFDGVLSVEHEDPVWGGSPERVEAGLEIAHRNLRPLIV